MHKKVQTRIRRSRKARAKIKSLGMTRLSVNKTPRHTYAQLTSADGAKTLASANTLQKEVLQQCENGTANVSAATIVGEIIAKHAKDQGITKVAFDRSGFAYHGRIKAIAEAARANGLEF